MLQTGLSTALRHTRAPLEAGLLAVVMAIASPCNAQTAADHPLTARQPLGMRAAPDGVSRIVAKVPAQASLEQLAGRYGPWIQARTTQGVVGWVLILDVTGVRPPQAAATAGGPTGTGTGNAGSDKPVATAASATAESPTVAEQRLLQALTYRAESEAARRFAFRASLELVKLPPSLTTGPQASQPLSLATTPVARGDKP